MDNKKEFYSIPETANLLGFSNSTIKRAIDEGRIKATKVLNRWRISQNEIQRLIGEGEKQQ